MSAEPELAPQHSPAARPPIRAALGGGLITAGLLTIAVSGLCGYLVAHAWGTCLYDTERYGFALMLSAPVVLLVNAVVFGLACPLAILAGQRTSTRVKRFARLVGVATALGIIVVVLAIVLYVELAAMYFTWAAPDDLTRCVGHVPSWWFSWRTG